MILQLKDQKAQNIQLTGGKGANLSRLLALPDITVPDGFVVTTQAFGHVWQTLRKSLTDTASAADIRQTFQTAVPPQELVDAIHQATKSFSPETLFAVRSSATAEDLPDASFAGQQDSYLNVPADEVPQAVMNCFASLYNDRAVAYRKQQGFGDDDVAIAVVVQEMVDSQVSGVLFTADPMTSDRLTSVIEAVEGLGEELVSGRKTPHTWRIKGQTIVSDNQPNAPLTDNQLMELIALGKRIEAAFQAPQDIEWCWRNGQFYIVQSRAITTLFPIPPSHDGFKRLFVSAGHMQMMTDVILPLGMSFMHKVSLFRMVECGGRLFIDITHDMKTAYGKKMIHQKMAAMDPLIHRAIEQVMKDKQYLAAIPKGSGSFSSFGLDHWIPILRQGIGLYRRNNPADIDRYVERMEASVSQLKQTLDQLSGTDVLDAIEKDQSRLMDVIYDATGFGAVLATQYAIGQIDRLGKQLTGEPNLSNRLSKSVEHNVSSEMGLALNEVSDLIRDYPEVVSYLEQSGADFTLEELSTISGGEIVARALDNFLQRYGMRATGEIDITKTRFNENPAELIPTILSNIRSLPVGHGRASFRQGLNETQTLIHNLLNQANQRLGRKKANKLAKNIAFFRNYLGTREYPKYFWICRYDVYKQALMREAKKLVEQSVLVQAEDIYYLSFEELRHVVATGQVNQDMIDERKAAYVTYSHLTPPRAIFSDGEVPEVDYARQLPAGALAGLGVSSGVVEGRARVIESIEDAVMEPGDILVTSFTDPSWTPVFVSLAGLVTEIGGMMNHGAVITREYGLPAVVGVVGATQRIKDGDLIRINGDEGYVEIL